MRDVAHLIDAVEEAGGVKAYWALIVIVVALCASTLGFTKLMNFCMLIALLLVIAFIAQALLFALMAKKGLVSSEFLTKHKMK